MDQFFDRLETLFKSFVNDTDEKFGAGAKRSSTGDTFFDDAMDELDAFLNDDKEFEAKKRAEDEARQKAYNERQNRSNTQSGGPQQKLTNAYKTLGLAYGAPFETVRASYKKLLKEHHPDRHNQDPVAQKKATETCALINNAYRIIETWHETGTLGNE